MQLPETALHIWKKQLTADADELSHLKSLLSSDELERANRFVRDEHRDKFIIAHAFLRLVIAQYIDLSANAIQFLEGVDGKPYINDGLSFNISHSGDYCLVAISRSDHIGVDIEKMTADGKLDVAERFFSQEENQILRQTPPNDIPHAFFNIWALKEALLKATGKGITSIRLNSFSVALNCEKQQIALDGQDWEIYSLDVVPGYASAVAVNRPVQTIQICELINQTPSICSTITTKS